MGVIVEELGLLGVIQDALDLYVHPVDVGDAGTLNLNGVSYSKLVAVLTRDHQPHTRLPAIVWLDAGNREGSYTRKPVKAVIGLGLRFDDRRWLMPVDPAHGAPLII